MPVLAIGRYHSVAVLERRGDSFVLDAAGDRLALRAAEAPAGTDVGASLRVFLYTDSEGRAVATCRTPRAAVGEMACCEVVSVSAHGAHLDWGLPKDLFVPFREQHRRMAVGERHVVAVYVDERTNRIVGSSRLGRHFVYDASALREGQEVKLLVYGFNGLGAQVVVEGRHPGLAYASDTFRALAIGDELTGWVRRIRVDGKVDVALQRQGRPATLDAQAVLLARLREAGGTLPLHDKSSPDEITRTLGMSKHAFKKAVGGLYKARRLVLLPNAIALTDDSGQP